ncbi:hypothetical protein KJ605_01295 [Patescibacteria group bacterium]|nr:hypothetical protein [Patescibacteria group bacterium]MBU1970394.1 hypothetical protein [Patescibacteria group bacterium]
MTREIEPKYFKDFKDFVVKKFKEHDKKFDRIDSVLGDLTTKVGDLTTKVGDLTIRVMRMEDKIDEIDKRTEFLPKLYDAVDKFMKEIMESRQERVFINHRLKDHEERLVHLETAS